MNNEVRSTKKRDLCLSDLYFLRTELELSIEHIIERKFFEVDSLDYDWVRYKNLVRLYKKINSLILDIEDERDNLLEGIL